MNRVLIVDDKPLLAGAMRQVFEDADGFEVVGVVYTGEQAIEWFGKSKAVPHIVIMDIQMPGMGGIEATRLLKQKHPQVRVVMASVHDGAEFLHDSIKAGASGYLLKDERPEVIIEAVLKALDGEAPLSASMASKAFQLIREGGTKTVDNPGLTPREIELLVELAQGSSYEQAAAALFISPHTVRKHVEHAYKKLSVHSKVQAVNEARRRGLLS
ncbi:MAG: response regulator [Saprospiraceae bacterium]